MRSLRHVDRDAVLITEAPMSADEEFSNRRRRYLLMMLGRAVCVVGAVLVFHVSGWLAAAFLLAAAVLPWAAVLLANARPAKQAVRFRRYLPGDTSSTPQLGPAPKTGGPKTGGPKTGGPKTGGHEKRGHDTTRSANESTGARIIDL